MGRVMQSALGAVVAVACVAGIGGCGDAGSGHGTTGARAKGGCAPVAGQRLVVLADDKKLQAANNIIPAVNAAAASPALMGALNRASEVLTSERLIGLNKATDVDRTTSKAAAAEFAASVRLTDGIARGPGGRIVVGASSVSESQTLGFVYQIALSAAGYDANVQPVGSREQYEPALE